MRPLRVVLAEGAPDLRDGTMALIHDAGFEVVGEAVEWDRVAELVASRAADVVVVAGDSDYAAGLSVIGRGVASIVVASDATAAKEYADLGSFGVVTPDTPVEMVTALTYVAVARAAELADVRREADGLREQLEARKVVERAKGVLMRRLGISEEAAYRRMQKASQDENKKLRQIADSILSAEKLLDAGTDEES